MNEYCEHCRTPLDSIQRADMEIYDNRCIIWFEGKCPVCGTYQAWHTYYTAELTEIDMVETPGEEEEV